MPRVDARYYMVDVSIVDRVSEEEVKELIDWALGSNAIIALEAGIASVRGPTGPLLVAYGPASIFSPEPPPVGSYLELARSEWVTGCAAGVKKPMYVEAVGPGYEVAGLVIAKAYQDPVAILVNGYKGALVLAPPQSDVTVYAEIDGRPVLGYSQSSGYINYVVEGPLRRRIKFAAILVSSCELKD